MSVYKDNATGKWRVIYRYTDITGRRIENYWIILMVLCIRTSGNI